MQPLEQLLREGRLHLLKRKSGDRPDEFAAFRDLDGRVAEHSTHVTVTELDAPPFLPATRKSRMPDRRKTVTLVLGGVRSGKSRFAQTLAERAASVAFLATALPCDDEMRRKIERHQAERPASWTTFEEPVELDRVLREQSPTFDMLLIDCLTLYTANLMHQTDSDRAAVQAHVDRLCAAVAAAGSSVVMVSNEVGSGVHPESALGRHFANHLSELNQRMAQLADRVILMVAGLPMVVKGGVA